jgi:hypothetical protein
MTESTGILIFANMVTLGLALLLSWPMDVLLWPYWIQSIAIGIFARQRLVVLEQALATQTEPAPPDEWSARASEANPRRSMSIAVFFSVFYGGWFLIFLGALVQNHSANIDVWDILGIAAAGAAFAYNHWFSYRDKIPADIANRPTLLSAFFAPFLRAAPMFVGGYVAQELASGTTAWAVIAFCLAKTAIAAHRGTNWLLR